MSSILLEKSQENLLSARLLMDESRNHYNVSTQCSYYSCIQVIKHLLIHKIFGSEEEIKRKLKEYKQEGRSGNSHAFYINQTRARLKSDGYVGFSKKFNEHMFDLKLLRENSAYYEISVNSDESETAIKLAMDIVNTLNNYYNLDKK